MGNTKMLVTFFRLSEQERQERYLPKSASDILNKKQFAIGSAHIVVSEQDGTVTAYGDNSCGQCEVSEWKKIKKVVAGEFHTAALTEEGTVLAAGDNQFGQCNVSGWSGIVDLFAENHLTVAISENGVIMVASKSPEESAPPEPEEKQPQRDTEEFVDQLGRRVEQLLLQHEDLQKKELKKTADYINQTLELLDQTVKILEEKLEKAIEKSGVQQTLPSGKNNRIVPVPNSSASKPIIPKPSVPKQAAPKPSVPKIANAPNATPETEFSCQTVGNYVKIHRYQGTRREVVIPEIIDGKPVQMIDTRAFEKNSFLERVTLPRNLRTIGGYAFRDCANLKQLEIPADCRLKAIGECAFEKCKNLSGMQNEKYRNTLVFPKGVETISRWAFEQCSSLKEIAVPSTVQSIGFGAFSECTSLTKLELPNSLRNSLGRPDLFIDNVNLIQWID